MYRFENQTDYRSATRLAPALSGTDVLVGWGIVLMSLLGVAFSGW